MRVWDALLSEGAKILYRVALALLKTHEDRLLAQDNAGYVQREMKLASAGMHDRDALMKVRTAQSDTKCPHSCSGCCILSTTRTSLQSASKPAGQLLNIFPAVFRVLSLALAHELKLLSTAYRILYESQYRGHA